jgi:FKBP-type peptidyl-prolyl cis-trans isomerase FklB
MIKNVLLAGLMAAIALTACSRKPDYNVKLKNDTDTMSYYMGLWTGNSMKTSGQGMEEMNVDAFARGMSEAIKSDSLPLTQEAIATYLDGYFVKAQQRQAEKNLEAGREFLEENKKKDGIVTLPSGLQYQVMTEGTGAQPDTSSTVTIHYIGSTIGGKEFENSREMGAPATFPLTGGGIAGFQEAILGMKEGAIWKVYIPSEMGYGDQVRPGGPIGPNEVLVFEIELIKVEATPAVAE